MARTDTKGRRIAVGTRCGMLEVTEPTDLRKNGYTVWRCVCDCGGECLLDTRALQRGCRTDCGCRTRLPPGAVDLTGQRFGRLTALAPTDQRGYGGRIIWRCRCDCGADVPVSAGQLTGGYTKSCGCLEHPPLKELVGNRFGLLTVLEYAGKRSGMHRWKCRCDCGREAVVGQTLLQSGKTKSCGCLQSTVILESMQYVDNTSVRALESALRHPTSPNSNSGYRGIYQTKKGKWTAQITFRRKKIHLGSFSTLEDALKARRRGEELFTAFLEDYYRDNIKR